MTGKGVVISAKHHPWRKVFRINPDLTHRFSIFIHLSHIWNDAKINNSLNDFGINICNHYCCFLLAEYSSSIVNFCCLKTKYKLISLHISIYICTGWPAGPTFPTFPYFLIQSPTFPYFLKNSPIIPTFLGCHVVKLMKAHLKHVFLHWFSTYNVIFVDKKPLATSNNVYFCTF